MSRYCAPFGLAVVLALGLVAALLGPLPSATVGPSDGPAPLAVESLAAAVVLVRGPSRGAAHSGPALKGFAAACVAALSFILLPPVLASASVVSRPRRRSAGATWFPLRC
jgi:hypothetical protein